MMTPIYTGGGPGVGTPIAPPPCSSSSTSSGGSGGSANELQATLEFCLELYKFYNVDLFLRGYYQLQVSLRVITKLPARVEINLGSSANNNQQHQHSTPASQPPTNPPSSTKHKKSSSSVMHSTSTPSVPAPPPPPPPPPPATNSPSSISMGAHTLYANPSPSSTTSLQSSSSITSSNSARSRSFRILFRNEEIDLQDLILFRVHLQLHENNSSNRLLEELHRVEYHLDLKLCFNDTVVSSRTLQINLTKHVGIHYYRPVFFDYFHLCAVSISIHGGLIAVHITKGSLSKSPDFLLNSASTGTTGCVPSATSHSSHSHPYSTSKLIAAKHTHETLMNILMESNVSLKSKLVEFLQVLGQFDLVDSVRSVNFLTSYTKSSDFDRFIKAGKSKSDEEIEDFLIQCHKDIAQLCAENILLWHRFLDLVIGKEPVRVYLSQLHHTERVKRFEEGFYITENPLRSAYTSKDYTPIVELLKKSLNYSNLQLECGELDGDPNTIPIIFEDQFVSLNDSATGQGATSGLMTSCSINAMSKNNGFKCQEVLITSASVPQPKNGSVSILDSGISSTALSLSEECSCGMAEILLKQQKLATRSCGGNTEKMLQVGVHTGATTGSLKNNGLRNGKKLPSHSKSLDLLQDAKNPENTTSGTQQRHPHAFVKSNTVISSTSSSSSCSSNNKKPPDEPPVPPRKPPNKLVKQRVVSGTSAEAVLAELSMAKLSLAKSQPSILCPNNLNKQSNNVHIGIAANVACIDGLKCKKKRRKKTALIPAKPTTLMLNPKVNDTTTNTLPRRHSSSAANQNNQAPETRYAADGEEYVPYQPPKQQPPPDLHLDVSRAASDLRKYSSTPLLSDLASMEYYLTYNASSLEMDQTSEESGWVSNSSETPDALHSDDDDDNVRVIEGISSSEEEEDKKQTIKSKKPNGLNLFIHGNSTPMVVPPPKEFRDKKLNGTTANAATISPPSGEPDDMIPPMTNLAPLCPPEEFRDLEDEDQSQDNSAPKSKYALKPKKFSSLQYRKHVTSTELQFPNGSNQNGESVSAAVTPKRSSVALLHTPTQSSVTPNRRGSLDCNCLLQDAKVFSTPAGSCANIPTTPVGNPCPPQSASNIPPNFQTIPYFLIPDELRVFHPKGLHLIICVHGLDGSCHDLRLFKIYLEVSLPGQNIHFLMSEKNQDGLTFSDFSQMTDKFVAEILAYMDTNKLNPSRISFVGHSLGNIIIRSALTRPQLAHLLPKLHTFLSLSGPHLGTLYNGSGLVNMGMWLMQKWKKSSSLLQLGLKDHSDIRQTFLYKLSEKSNLHRFRNVLLCGSAQDRYVPVHSAHILNCKQSLKDGSLVGEAYREMVMNILNPILTNNVKLVRYDVHHAIASHSANSIIGRAAHIAVLDSEIFIEKFLSVSAIKYFQ